MSWKRIPCGTAMAVLVVLLLGAVLWRPAVLQAQQPPTSYSPVVMQEEFQKTVARMSAAKPQILERHMRLLQERYDLSNRPAEGATMSRGKPVQAGVRVKLPAGVNSWEELAAMSPEEIRKRACGRKASCPCRTRTIPRAAWCSRSITSTRSSGRKVAT